MRTVAHLDMDCFYAQVESQRLNLPESVPLVVQQWKNVIAVNYPSRKFGIKRGMAAAECKRLCPHVVCAQVELIEHEYSTAGTVSTESFGSNSPVPAVSGPTVSGSSSVSASGPSSVSTGVVKKVSLERYRVASEQIMGIICSMNPHCEKGGIDEIFLEVDHAAVVGAEGAPVLTVADFHREVALLNAVDHAGNVTAASASGGTEVDGDGRTAAGAQTVDTSDLLGTWDGAPLDPEDPFSSCLLAAALHVYRIRKAVLDQTGYVVSAGVAGNKMLAKQASAARKPNKQTLVPLASIDAMMRETRVKDLRGLGGKLGQQVVEATGASCAFELQSCALPLLSTRFGDKTGRWIYSACRGIDHEPVAAGERGADGSNLNESMLKKSIAASKGFSLSLTDRTALMPWLTVLCTDIHARLVHEDTRYRRRARSLSIYHRGPSVSLSRTCKLPSLDARVPTIDVMVQTSLRLIETRVPRPFPINGISVSVGDFVTLQRGKMTSLFASAAPGASSRPAAGTDTDFPVTADNAWAAHAPAVWEHRAVSSPNPVKSPTGILKFCSKRGSPEDSRVASSPVPVPVPSVCSAVTSPAGTSTAVGDAHISSSYVPVSTAIAPVSDADPGATDTDAWNSDLELARRLQESYDREDRAISSFDRLRAPDRPVAVKKRKATASSSINKFFAPK